MIISQIDAGLLSSENLIKDFQNEMGYSFEIKAHNDLELNEEPLIDKKLLSEVKAEIVEEVKMVICYACGISEREETNKEPLKAVAYGPPQNISEIKRVRLDAAIQAREAKVEVKPSFIDAVAGEAVEAKLIKAEYRIKLPIKYHMMKKMYHRLNNFVEKLTSKYERLSNETDNEVKNLKPLKIINRLLERINSVQEHFTNRLTRIEKKTGQDITIYGNALDKIQDLEDKLEQMQKEILNSLRGPRALKLADKHIIKINDDGVISCGF